LSELPITPVIAKANSKCFALISPESRNAVRVLLEVRMDRLALKFHEAKDMKVRDETYDSVGN
jgi:hypothetical protein